MHEMKRFLLILIALSLLIGLVGCVDGFTIQRDEEAENRSEKTEYRDDDDEDETEPSVTEPTVPETTVTEPVVETEPPATEPAALLPELPVEFLFMSGVGGWATSLSIGPDGTFEGYYMDSDMGDTGEDYPNGTMYECAFSGKFTDIQKVSEFEYSMRLEYLDQEGEIGSERIEDGVRIITSDPYGMANPDEFLLYLPGRPTADLPEEFIDWVSMPNVWAADAVPETLPFFGLYNVGGAEGFFGG
jgi:hypothetical protein